MATNKVRVGLRIPDHLNGKLADEAQEKGMSKNALMLQILWKYIERRRQA